MERHRRTTQDAKDLYKRITLSLIKKVRGVEGKQRQDNDDSHLLAALDEEDRSEFIHDDESTYTDNDDQL